MRHWSDPAYNSPRFAEQVLREIPREARLVVDPAHVFEAYLARRPTVLAATEDFYFNATTVPYDFLIASRFALSRDIPRTLEVRLVRTHGDPADPFACFAEVYEATRAESVSP